MSTLRVLFAASLALCAAGCEGGSGSSGGPGPVDSGSDASDEGGAQDAGSDEGMRSDAITDATGEDPGPQPDVTGDEGGGQPDLPKVDAEPGTLEMGEPCDEDAQCVTGLCWVTSVAKGCTVSCTSMAECEAYGLLCVAIREGVGACVPEILPAADDCEGHDGCVYPLSCRADQGWCSLPECTWDADCPAGQECETLARRCQPTSCVSTVECENPAEVCIDGACGAPACESDDDCDGDDYCHPVQKTCQTPADCASKEDCYYNEQCTGGFCLPDLCYAPCNEGETCDPDMGVCGLPCASHDDCPNGQACAVTGGICYPNEPPMARAVAVTGGGELAAADVPVGSPVQISGEGSIDPEGEAVTYAWTLEVTPPGSGQVMGAAIGGGAVSFAFTPDVDGLFAIGLRVSDPAGASGIEAQVVLWAQ